MQQVIWLIDRVQRDYIGTSLKLRFMEFICSFVRSFVRFFLYLFIYLFIYFLFFIFSSKRVISFHNRVDIVKD